jgi:hypothetical protein
VNLLRNDIADDGLSSIDIAFKQSENLQSICGATGSELDLSNQNLGAEDAKLIAIEIKQTQTLCVLNLADNRLGANLLPDGWRYEYMSCVTGGLPFRHEDGTEQKDHPGKPEGIIAVAAALKDNTTLLSLHVGQNGIPKKEMKEIMAIATNKESMTILCEVPFKDTNLAELDISGKKLGVEGALVVAQYLDGNTALSKLIFGGATYQKRTASSGGPTAYEDMRLALVDPEPAIMEIGLTMADLSNKNLGPGDAIIISTWISHKYMGALTSLNLSSNSLAKASMHLNDMSGNMHVSCWLEPPA